MAVFQSARTNLDVCYVHVRRSNADDWVVVCGVCSLHISTHGTRRDCLREALEHASSHISTFRVFVEFRILVDPA